MMTIALFAIVLGLVLYFIPGNAKVNRVGEILFAFGTLTLLLAKGSTTLLR